MEEEYTLQQSDDEYQSENIENYIFYKIIPKNNDINYCYVGHTTNFTNRNQQHKKHVKNENYNKSHYKLYQTIRQNGGWDEWEMIEIEKLNCETKLKARIREQELIEQHNANLNSLKAYISEEQRKELKKQITQKYREENKELLKEQTKKYKEEHKDIIAEQMKKYRAEHKQEIDEKTKEYREKNKEKHQQWQKNWAEKNKETLKEKRKLKNAELKAEKLKQKTLLEQTPEWQEKQKQVEAEKEQLKKEKRDEYNELRRLKRLQEKQQK
jgi:hypothetical protein